jgi:hypothetical protein
MILSIFSIVIASLTALGIITPQQQTASNQLIQQISQDLNLTYSQVQQALTLQVGSQLYGLQKPCTYIVSHPLGDTSITAIQNGTTGAFASWGTNATQQINSIIASGETISFRESTYVENGSIVLASVSNVQLLGVSGSTLFVSNGMDAPAILCYPDANNCTIDGLSINGNDINQPTPSGLVLTDATDGVLIVDCNNTVVQNCNIYHCRCYGVAIFNSFYVPGYGGWNNKVQNCKITFANWNGITAAGTGSSTIINNEIAYSGDVGITVTGTNCLIENNYCHDINGTSGSVNTQWCMGTEDGGNDIFSGNTCQNGLYGIFDGAGFGNNTIESNMISNTRGSGIVEAVPSGTIIGNVIDEWDTSNNTVATFLQNGILVSASNNNLIMGNKLSCTISTSGGATGINFINGAANNCVEGNYFFASPSYCLTVSTTTTNTLIEGNYFYSWRSIAIAFFDSTTTGASIQNNYFLPATGKNLMIYQYARAYPSITGNYGYNPVGLDSTPVLGSYLVDFGGTGVIASGVTYTCADSPAMIVGNSTTTVVTAITLNGQAVAPTLPLQVASGQTFSITYTGGIPLVFKQ